VLVQEHVVNLPQDQGKWYISVVGDANDARYRTVLSWFDTHENLKHLKDQVHFCPVKSNTAIYKERYAPNVKGLPTVRVQDSKGVVIYEVAGLAIPLTPDALYAAIANDVQVAQGCRPILPWRREMERRCRPCPQPNPQPQPDPDPQPLPPLHTSFARRAPFFGTSCQQGIAIRSWESYQGGELPSITPVLPLVSRCGNRGLPLDDGCHGLALGCRSR